MSKSLIILILILAQGCIVVDKNYVPLNHLKKDPTFKIGSLNFSCEISHGNNHNLTVFLWFNTSYTQTFITNMIVDLKGQDSLSFDLRSIELSCTEKGIGNVNDNNYVKKNFGELPKDVKMTVINGYRALYLFHFTSTKSIYYDKIQMHYLVELENGITISDNVVLKLSKSGRFAVH